MIKVKLFATLRSLAGEKELTTNAGTISELINDLTLRYDSDFKKHIRHATFLINGTNITLLKGKNTRLKDGDDISVFPPLGGG